MHTNQATPSTRRTPSEKTGSDAIKLLIDDHNKVKKMFKEFEKISKNNAEEEKEALATQNLQGTDRTRAVGRGNILSRGA